MYLFEKHGGLQSFIHSFHKYWLCALSVSRALLGTEDVMMSKTGYSPGLQKLTDWRRGKPWSWDFCPVALKALKPFLEPRPGGAASAPQQGCSLVGWPDPCVPSLPSASGFSSGRGGDPSPPHLIHCLFSSSSERSAKENHHAHFADEQTEARQGRASVAFALLSPRQGLSLDSLLPWTFSPAPSPLQPERH